MKLEEPLTSLELSKRLKELEVKQDSTFYWILEKEDGTEKEKVLNNHKIVSWNDKELYNYSAYSTAELFEIFTEEIKEWLNIRWANNKFKVSHPHVFHLINSEKIADAMAKMLIYLLEKKMIKL